ncbi:Limbic system-associated membrane protein, partial [Dissostichus eleginoides]
IRSKECCKLVIAVSHQKELQLDIGRYMALIDFFQLLSFPLPSPSYSSPHILFIEVAGLSEFPADIYKVSEDITVNEGNNLTLSCLARGRPDPAINWRLLNPSAEPLDGEEYLDIIGIMRNQAGRYECKASNDVATPDVKYVNVVVSYPPTIKKTQSSETPVGRMGTLQCDATAVPTPEFEWYRDEKRLSNAQGINIQILGTTTILMIANVTEEDYGNYTCVASNRLGVQNASLFLYSEYKH